MKKSPVIHPLLFALFAVLALYSANVREVSPSQVWAPTLVVLGCVILLLVIGRLVYRSMIKAGLATSLIVVLCFSYGHIVNLIGKSPGEGFNFFTPISGMALLILLAWFLLGGVGLFLIYTSRIRFGNLTTFLNILGVMLVVVATITIVANEIRGGSHSMESGGETDIQLSIPETLPDIYCIILDRYASASALKERLGFDNSEFIDYLTGRGFYVADESRCNYLSTQHSLASSLNLEYLDGLAERIGDGATDMGPLYTMLEDYKVWRLLKSAGYEFIHIGQWWEPTRENKYADMNINYGGSLPEFSRLLLKTTAIDPIGRILGLWGDERITQYERVKYQFDRLSRIPEIEQPTFVFAHFLTPHPDYVFDRNGDFLPIEEAVKRNLETRYLDQLIATNQLVMSCIDRLFAESSVPPIIILQSEEGPYPDFADGFKWTENEGSDLDLRVKSGILNAYYLPGADQSVLYPSITPVNSFRLVFNLYFDAGLQLLPDRYYYWYPGQPYRFIDITERLKPAVG